MVDHITDVPIQGILEASQMPFLHGKQLADPGRGSRIDLLIGMPDIPDCYTQSMVSSSDQKLEAHESIFGWVVRGNLHRRTSNSPFIMMAFATEMSLYNNSGTWKKFMIRPLLSLMMTTGLLTTSRGLPKSYQMADIV